MGNGQHFLFLKWDFGLTAGKAPQVLDTNAHNLRQAFTVVGAKSGMKRRFFESRKRGFAIHFRQILNF
jgi:hypothetical protein